MIPIAIIIGVGLLNLLIVWAATRPTPQPTTKVVSPTRDPVTVLTMEHIRRHRTRAPWRDDATAD